MQWLAKWNTQGETHTARPSPWKFPLGRRKLRRRSRVVKRLLPQDTPRGEGDEAAGAATCAVGKDTA